MKKEIAYENNFKVIYLWETEIKKMTDCDLINFIYREARDED